MQQNVIIELQPMIDLYLELSRLGSLMFVSRPE